MEEELHKLLLDIDYGIEIDISEYFLLSESSRQEITDEVFNYLYSKGAKENKLFFIIINAVKILKYDAIRAEEYEKADLWNRIEKKFESKTFLFF